MTVPIREFDEDREWSDEHEELLRLAYRYLFPEYVFQQKNRGDNPCQRAGIDRNLIAPGGTSLLIDEKMRRRIYEGDILLETVSNTEIGTLGWIEKNAPLSYLNCVYVPVRFGVLISWPLLKTAWGAYGHRWSKTCREVIGTTKLRGGPYYHTRSVAVPEKTLIEVGVTLTKYSIPFPVRPGNALQPPPPPKQWRLL
jgi:hypothetical protein